MMIKTIEWTDAGVVMIDQLRLPTEEVYNTYTTCEEVAEAIRSMVIRGARLDRLDDRDNTHALQLQRDAFGGIPVL